MVDAAGPVAPVASFDPASVLPGGPAAPDLSQIVATVSRRDGPVPLGVTFQLLSPDPQFSNFLLFGTAEWRFSYDPAEDYAFRHLDSDLAGERAGSASGAYVGHVYVTPGAHRWRVTLRYPGMAPRTIETATALLDGAATDAVVAHDPEAYFAGRTVYFSNAFPSPEAFRAAAPDLGIAGDLPLSRYRVGDAAFRDSLGAVSGRDGPPWRFALQAGRRYILDERTLKNGVVNCFVDRFGDGADPVLTLDARAVDDGRLRGGFFFGVDDKTGDRPCGLANLDIRGLYDSADPGFVEPSAAVRGVLINNPRNFGVQIFRCRISGVYTGVNCVKRARATLIADSRITSWFNYGVWHGQQDDSAIVGCDIKQKAGTVNVGRKSTAVADTGDRMSFRAPGRFTARFDWSREWERTDRAPGTGPRPKRRAPPIPPEEGPPRSGGWNTVSDWWKANWGSFRWTRPNALAFRNHDNAEHRNAAVHGPYRAANPGFRVGLHQCELRSLNGWSRSRAYRADLPPEDQPDDAFAIQPCLRIATAVDERFLGHSTSIDRLSLDGGSIVVAVLPQRKNVPTADARTLPLAITLSNCVLRAGAQTRGLVGFGYGRCAIANSLLLAPDEPTDRPQPLRVFGAHKRPVDPGSAPIHVYNVTVVIERRAPEAELTLLNTDDGRRPIVARNLLLLLNGTFANGDAYVAAEAFDGLVRGPFGGVTAPYAPSAGSNVLGAADALAPYRDITGAVRPSPAALGAFEASD